MLLSFSCLWLMNVLRAAQGDAEPSSKTLEAYVLDQTKAGEIADADKFSPWCRDKAKAEGRDKGCRLSAEFVSRLISSTNISRTAKGVRLSHVRIDGALDLHNADVSTELWLEDCWIQSLEAGDAHFKKLISLNGSTVELADFRRARMDSLGLFRGTHFSGSANFLAVQASSNIEFDGAVFDNAEPDARTLFESLTVAGHFKANDARFVGFTDFRRLKTGGNLELDRTKFIPPEARYRVSADLTLAHVGGDLRLVSGQFEDQRPVSFGQMSVEGAAFFLGTSFAGGVDLGGARFGNIRFENVAWPAADKFLRLNGMTYGSLEFGDGDATTGWRPLLQRATFSPEVYVRLEKYFQDGGNPEEADAVFIAMKRRARREVLPWYSAMGSLVEDVLVGYGRRPWLAFLYAIAFITIGAFVFRWNSMEPAKKSEPLPKERVFYNPIFYSAAMFLPGVNLYAGEYLPKSNLLLANIYLRLHVLFGWVLVPFGIAALAGIVR